MIDTMELNVNWLSISQKMMVDWSIQNWNVQKLDRMLNQPLLSQMTLVAGPIQHQQLIYRKVVESRPIHYWMIETVELSVNGLFISLEIMVTCHIWHCIMERMGVGVNNLPIYWQMVVNLSVVQTYQTKATLPFHLLLHRTIICIHSINLLHLWKLDILVYLCHRWELVTNYKLKKSVSACANCPMMKVVPWSNATSTTNGTTSTVLVINSQSKGD